MSSAWLPDTSILGAFLSSGRNGFFEDFPFFRRTIDFLTASLANSLCSCLECNNGMNQKTTLKNQFQLLELKTLMLHTSRYLKWNGKVETSSIMAKHECLNTFLFLLRRCEYPQIAIGCRGLGLAPSFGMIE